MEITRARYNVLGCGLNSESARMILKPWCFHDGFSEQFLPVLHDDVIIQ